MRMTKCVLAVAVVIGCGGLLAAAPAGAVVTRPTVSGFSASPGILYRNGGTVTLSATVAAATSCVFSSTPALTGLPYTATPCNGPVTHVVSVPGDSGKRPVKYTFKLAAVGSRTVHAKPVAKLTVGTGAPPATAVSAGGRQTCALLAGGSAECWGYDNYGQLGDARTSSTTNVPVAVIGLSGAVQVSSGYGFTCALVTGGTVECWGFNANGQLGDGTGTGSLSPVNVLGLTGPVASISSASGGGTCAVITGGAVQCWGSNAYDELGPGGGAFLEATTVSGLSGPAVAVATGERHSCALINDGTVQCWGAQWSGELGDGSYSASSPTPETVLGVGGVGHLQGVTAVTTGAFFTCALLSGGTVDCWGDNSTGELGNGYGNPGIAQSYPTPVPVSGISGAVRLSAAGYHTCAVVSGGTVRCWGDNNEGELGDGTNVFAGVPSTVSGISGASDVTTGGGSALEEQSCALLSGGSVDCWGSNAEGQLGNGSSTNSNTPVSVTGL